MRKRVRHTVAAMLLIGLGAQASAGSSDDFDDKFLQLATGPRGGAFRPIGESLCDTVNQDRALSHVRCVAVGTAGSTFNLHAVKHGDLQLGLAQEDLLDALYAKPRGTGAAAAGANSLRAITLLHTSPIAVMAHRDAGITSLEQIAGKRMNLGNRGSGQFVITAALLRSIDLRVEQLGAVSYLATSEMDKAFCERRIDVVVEAMPHPTPLYEKLRSCGGEFVDIPPAAVARMVAENKLLMPMTIAAQTYGGQTRDVLTLGMRNVLFTDASVSEEAVFRFAQALARNFDELRSVQPLLGSMVDPGTATQAGLTVPLHPGALRAWKARAAALARATTTAANTATTAARAP